MKDKLQKVTARVLPGKKRQGHDNTDSMPRITNDTVAEHREKVLGKARKYIYPLQHSKHRVVIISISLFVVAVLTFMTYTLLSLYKFQTNSTFMYRITQIIPFPIAKTGSSYVAYENYLFELRRYVHYYESQQGIDFSSESGKQQLEDFKSRALNSVIADAQVKQLAKEHKISVSQAEIDDHIELLRSQNRLGSSDQVFEDVLAEFWGWSVSDFRRELYSELLAQKVVAALDTEAQDRAQAILAELQGGADFAEVAKQQSDDESTKANGGEYGIDIERTNRDITPEVIQALFSLEAGQVSDILVTPTALEIVKVLESSNGTIRAAHIAVNLAAISEYTDELQKEQGATRFVSIPE